MKPLHYAVFLVIALAVFVDYSVFRETIWDVDSPAFIMYSCEKVPLGKDGSTVGMPLSTIIYKIMPCNMLFFKAFGAVMLFLSVLIIAKCGELFDKENGWLAGLFAFINPTLIPEMLRMEEIIFAYPLIFLGFYFLMKKEYLKSAILIGLSGLFWKGAIYYFVMLGFSWTILLPASIAIIVLFWNHLLGPIINGLNDFIPAIFGKEIVIENMIAIGFVQQWFLIIGTKHLPKHLLPPVIFCLVLAFLSFKYTLFAVPFLSVGFMLWTLKPDTEQKKGFFYIDDKKVFAAIMSFGLICFTLASLPSATPSNQDIVTIKKAIELADGNTILNDWGYGWWIKYYGGKTNNYSGQDFPDFNHWNGIAMTKKDTTCTVVFPDFQTPLKVLSCP